MTDWTSVLEPVPREPRFNRPLVVPPGQNKQTVYTRCTTFVGAIEDRYRLGLWEQRMVATGLGLRDDLRLAAVAHRDDKDKLDEICRDAMEAAEAHAKATIGTALHSLCEQLDRGLDPGPVPDSYAADLAAYQAATAGLENVAIERFMVLDALKVGGTPDRIVRVDGKLRIADIKTGSIKYAMGKIAMQLAVYARSQMYDPATLERTYTGVENDWGIVIHLPAGEGTCRLWKVDLLKGWNGVRLCRDVRNWRRAESGLFTDYAPPIEELIPAARTVEELRGLWAFRRPEWTPRHTELAKARTLELERGLRTV